MPKSGEARQVTCVMCGTVFTGYANIARYCPECKILRMRELKREEKERRKQERRKIKRENAAKKPAMSLAEVAAKARELGMTYGEYVVKYGG